MAVVAAVVGVLVVVVVPPPTAVIALIIALPIGMVLGMGMGVAAAEVVRMNKKTKTKKQKMGEDSLSPSSSPYLSSWSLWSGDMFEDRQCSSYTLIQLWCLPIWSEQPHYKHHSIRLKCKERVTCLLQ